MTEKPIFTRPNTKLLLALTVVLLVVLVIFGREILGNYLLTIKCTNNDAAACELTHQYQKACNLGKGSACLFAADELRELSQSGVEWDEKACELGEANGCFSAGRAYHHGKHYVKAQKYLTGQCNAGNLDACELNVANYWQSGNQPKALESAKSLCVRSRDRCPLIENMFARMSPRNPIPLEVLTALCDGGYAAACMTAGQRLMHGSPKDPSLAEQHYEKACGLDRKGCDALRYRVKDTGRTIELRHYFKGDLAACENADDKACESLVGAAALVKDWKHAEFFFDINCKEKDLPHCFAKAGVLDNFGRSEEATQRYLTHCIENAKPFSCNQAVSRLLKAQKTEQLAKVLLGPCAKDEALAVTCAQVVQAIPLSLIGRTREYELRCVDKLSWSTYICTAVFSRFRRDDSLKGYVKEALAKDCSKNRGDACAELARNLKPPESTNLAKKACDIALKEREGGKCLPTSPANFRRPDAKMCAQETGPRSSYPPPDWISCLQYINDRKDWRRCTVARDCASVACGGIPLALNKRFADEAKSILDDFGLCNNHIDPRKGAPLTAPRVLDCKSGRCGYDVRRRRL